jgi:DNA-binding transcriptional LysR family regulator
MGADHEATSGAVPSDGGAAKPPLPAREPRSGVAGLLQSLSQSSSAGTSNRSASHITPAKLEAFVAVAEEGSMSAASRRLHLSQPALSQTIHALERQLGVTLLERSTTGVRTTSHGLTLLSEARAYLVHHDRVLRVMADSKTEQSVITICIPAELDAAILRALATYAGDPRSPHVRVRQLTWPEQLVALRDGRLDLSLMRERPAGPDYDTALIKRDTLGVIVATSVAQAIGGPDGIRLDDLSTLEWVKFARVNSPNWYDEIAAVLRSHGIDIDHVGSDELLPITTIVFAAVSNGRSFALAPETWVNPIPDQVSWMPVVDELLVRRTWLVWPAESRRRDVARLISELEAAGDSP